MILAPCGHYRVTAVTSKVTHQQKPELNAARQKLGILMRATRAR